MYLGAMVGGEDINFMLDPSSKIIIAPIQINL